MKKRLFFPLFSKRPYSFIETYRNKIISYSGDSPVVPVSNEGYVEPKKNISNTELNSKFTIEKIDKVDKRTLDIKANYKISSEELTNITERECYVKLNIIESFLVNWYSKKYLIQSKEMKISIVKYIIGVVIGFIIGLFL